ncbi:AAA family ATPase, partial [Thiocapsa sp.]|uniref:PD-(D/E)XK nuclease domain-containing protein n=1 Tax=Thiocapsa sp. TaxID=2024551 RepID=UPI002B732108
SVIKDSDAHIRFAFLTGVSKFSKVSLFSGLDNLRDITLSREYSGICGYTEADLDCVFAPELEGLNRERIRLWYNGYNWTGEAVYNPFDVLLLFKERQFRPWWFETGTPTFLVDLLTERETWIPRLGHMETDATLLTAFEVDRVATEALLFQSGYLTIEREEEISGTYFYQLRYPNREVYQSLNGALLSAWTPPDQTEVQHRKSLHRLLLANDFAGLERLFTAFFAKVYLFEFKVVELEPEGRALQQIKDRGYADEYRADGQPIHLIGGELSPEPRQVVGFAVETLD